MSARTRREGTLVRRWRDRTRAQPPCRTACGFLQRRQIRPPPRPPAPIPGVCPTRSLEKVPAPPTAAGAAERGCGRRRPSASGRGGARARRPLRQQRGCNGILGRTDPEGTALCDTSHTERRACTIALTCGIQPDRPAHKATS